MLALLRQVLPSVLPQYPVEAAYVYGSAARGTMTSFSDVDIALVLHESFSSYNRLMLELDIQGVIEAAIGKMKPTSVDVRAINDAPLTVRGRIVQEGVLLYERDRSRRVAFEVETRKRYFDFAPVARRLRDAFLQHVHKEGLLRA
ncbi:MAG: nucleotidyltransferase domain-containing protein [Chloroflexota bacterium]|nr:nucleotidyltransferase domain-containing protein [Chloroflexota bacterium]